MAGLYIHIPFCHSKCAYCDFFSTPRADNAEAYTAALIKEFALRRDEVSEPFRTVYFGGGTPSSLPAALLDKLFSALPLDQAEEITIEVNPEDVTPKFVDFLRSTPVNRVSMGIQSLNDNELKFIGRRHTAAKSIDAYRLLRDSGFSNISLDLIFGLPGQTIESWIRTLDETIRLNSEHLSAYTLMLEPGTKLHAMATAGKFKPASDEMISEMYDILRERTTFAGYNHYEISNFSQPGFQSLHNSAYWDFTPYLGLGTGAHSFDGERRRFNPNRIKQYIETSGAITQIDEEKPQEIVNDYIMVRLRTAAGLSLSSLADRFGKKTAENVLAEARRFVKKRMLLFENDVLRIRPEHFMISDSIISELMI